MTDGKLIKAARVYYGISQKDLGEKLQIDQTTISAMESPGRQNVWSGYYERAAEFLKLQDPESPFIRSVVLSLVAEKEYRPHS